MALSDYYRELGLSNAATGAEIKRAYRQLAKECHPDVNPSGAERFMAVNEAYEVLMRYLSLQRAGKVNKIQDEWVKQASTRARERAYYHARQRMEQYQKSAIYRSAKTVSYFFDGIYLLVGAAMCVIPIVFTDYRTLRPDQIPVYIVATLMVTLFGATLIYLLIKSRIEQFRRRDPFAI